MTEQKAEYRVAGQQPQVDVLETHSYLIDEADAGRLNPDYLSPGRLCDLVSDLAAEVRLLRKKVKAQAPVVNAAVAYRKALLAITDSDTVYSIDESEQQAMEYRRALTAFDDAVDAIIVAREVTT